MTAKEIIQQSEAAAEKISEAIDKATAQTERDVLAMQKALFDLIRDEILPRLATQDGQIQPSRANLVAVSFLDAIFETWKRNEAARATGEFVRRLLSTAQLVAIYYTGEENAEQLATDTTFLQSALGVDSSGNVQAGSIIGGILAAGQVLENIKRSIVSAITGGQPIRKFLSDMRTYITGTDQADGVVLRYWKGNALDLFNTATEIQNDQVRQGLGLGWFLYAGDVIKDSREFCIKKAGKVFAVVEADKEWPKDPDLIGKTSGIPYTPRIDRGRWNCRHRIRYISEELAVQIDPKKVNFVKKKYGI